MATQVQLRRGTATENNSFTGAQGELTFDTTNKRVRVHDGATAGGFELKTENSSGDTLFADNEKAIFGAGSDLQIYHDGTDNYVDAAGVGHLILQSQGDDKDVKIKSDDGSGGLTEYFRADGSLGRAQMFYYGTKTLETTSTGIDVTGNATFADNGKAIFGAGSDLQIYHDGSRSIIYEGGTGELSIRANGPYAEIMNGGATETMARFNNNGSVDLYYDNSLKLATTSTGIDVTGTVTADGLTVDGNQNLNGDLKISDVAVFINMLETDTTDLNTRLRSANGDFYIETINDALNSALTRLNIDHSTGDISFYEDTGTTAKFFWDASAESLGIGTSSPNAQMELWGAASTYNFNAGTDPFANLAIINNNVNSGTGPAIVLGSVYTGSAAVANARIFAERQSTGSTNAGATDLIFEVGQASGSALAERMRIDSSGNVGIGETNPEAAIHIKQSANDFIILESTDLINDIIMSDTVGSVALRQQNAELIFRTGGDASATDVSSASEAMRIDSSGHLIVGDTNPSLGFGNTVEGVSIRNEGRISAQAANEYPLNLSRKSSDGDIAVFRKDGSAVGSIGTTGDRLYAGTGDTGLFFNDQLDSIDPWNTSTNAARDAAIDLGDSSRRFRDLYLSGTGYVGTSLGIGTYSPQNTLHLSETSPQIRLEDTNATGYSKVSGSNANIYLQADEGNTVANSKIDLRVDGSIVAIFDGDGLKFNGDTAAANALDDYEEGSYLPTVYGATTAGSTALNGSYNTLHYTKIGRQVTIQGEIRLSGSPSGAGGLRITLPFTNMNTEGSEAVGSIQFWNANFDNNAAWVSVVIPKGGAYLRFKETVDNGTTETPMDITDLGANAELTIGVTYFVA